jgi:hypothetical protein
MGLGGSKAQPQDDHEVFVYDQRKIYFDEFGNIRYAGHDAGLPNRDTEKEKIMKAELNIDDVSMHLLRNVHQH